MREQPEKLQIVSLAPAELAVANHVATGRNILIVAHDFTIILEPAEEGGYTAYIPEVPGAVSEGETKEEAKEMVLDAMRELLAYRRTV